MIRPPHAQFDTPLLANRGGRVRESGRAKGWIMKLQTNCYVILNDRRGFSLVETLIVCSLIAIISGASITMLTSFLPRFRLSGAAREVMTDLMQARMQAVSKKHKMLIEFPSSSQYKITEDRNNNGDADSGEPARIFDLRGSSGNVTVAASLPKIIFNPLGTAVLGATLSVTNPTGTKTVLVSLAGRVKIQ